MEPISSLLAQRQRYLWLLLPIWSHPTKQRRSQISPWVGRQRAYQSTRTPGSRTSPRPLGRWKHLPPSIDEREITCKRSSATNARSFHANGITRFGVRACDNYSHGRPTDDQRNGRYSDWQQTYRYGHPSQGRL